MKLGLYCFILLTTLCLHDASSTKIPIKSIKSPDGDIIDCINIYDQPALDHALLKDHTILMKPSYQPVRGFNTHTQENVEQVTQLWQSTGTCPDGTIPIRRHPNVRNTKEYSMNEHKSFPKAPSYDRKIKDPYIHEHAYAYVRERDSKYYGAKASINLWQPQVKNHHEISVSQIWITGGSDSDLNTIETGWLVYPDLFGDNRTRLFTYWTRDNYQTTGCYNLLCSGFVQTNNTIALGAALSPISTYHGQLYEIHIYVFKDTKRNAWWLQYAGDVLGYWPASLFTNLADSGSMVAWGGEAVNTVPNGQHTTTQMGSGHFPEEQLGGASYFRDLFTVDESNALHQPVEFSTAVDKPSCYNAALKKNEQSEFVLFYGGPGRNDKCP